MFRWLRKQAEINKLREQNCRLAGELSEAEDDIRNARTTIQGLKEQRDKIGDKCAEFADQRDAVAECLESEQKENQKLKSEIAQLKEALGHAIHGLAAFQSFSDGIRKRLDMMPDQLGLGTELASEILKGFDRDLEERKDFARDLERQSVTIEHRASEEGYLLVNSSGERTSLTVDQVEDALFGAASHVGEPSPEWDVIIDAKTVTSVTELGLFKVPVDLGKGVKVEVRVWVVPTAT